MHLRYATTTHTCIHTRAIGFLRSACTTTCILISKANRREHHFARSQLFCSLLSASGVIASPCAGAKATAAALALLLLASSCRILASKKDSQRGGLSLSNLSMSLFASMSELPQFAEANDAGSRQACLEAVMEEYHQHCSAGMNHNYRLDRKMQQLVTNLLVHLAPKAFKVLQAIFDKAPPQHVPITRDCLAQGDWLLGSVPALKKMNVCMYVCPCPLGTTRESEPPLCGNHGATLDRQDQATP